MPESSANVVPEKQKAAKRKRPKKRATLVGQLLALPPSQVLIKAEHVSEALESSDATTFNKLFEIAVQARQVDTVLEVILRICASSDKEVPLSFAALSQFSQYFVTLGSGTASETFESLLKILNGGKSDRVITYLINRLISSVDLLRNSKFRQTVKERLPSFISGQKYSHFLAESLCYTLLMEASYQDNFDISQLAGVWNRVVADNDPVTALFTLILHCCSVSEKKDKEVADYFCQSLEKFSSGSYEEDYKDLFLRVLDQHLSSVSNFLEAFDLQTFARFLLEHNLKSSNLTELTKSLHQRSDLSTGFYRCFYNELFAFLGRECQSFNGDIAESIEKITCSSKSAAMGRCLKKSLASASTSKWAPSPSALDVIQALCCNDVAELFPNQRFVVIFIISLITEGATFERTIAALDEISRTESVRDKLSRSVLKKSDDDSISVKSLHKAWLKKDEIDYKTAQYLGSLLAWTSLALFGEESVKSLLKIAAKSSSTSNIALAAAVDVFCQLEEVDDGLVDTITQRLDSVFEDKKWSNVKHMDSLVEVSQVVYSLQPLQRFCRFVHKQKKTFVELSNSSSCLKVAKSICRGKLKSEGADQVLYRCIVEAAADFLLFAGYVMSWEKSVIDWEYLIAMGRVDVQLSKKVLLRATNEEVAGLLSALPQEEIADGDVNLVLTIGRFIAERKSVSSLMVDNLEVFVTLMIREQCKRGTMQFATAVVPLLSGSPLEEDFVNLVLGMVAIVEWREIPDEDRLYLVGEVATLMVAVIRSSRGSDSFSVVGAIIGKLINLTHSLKKSSERSEVLHAEHERLEHTVASMCHTIVGFKDKFARIAPFVVSECLANDREAALSMHRLLGACDKFSIAMLSSNLPTAKKRCFAHVYPQFANVNKIVV